MNTVGEGLAHSMDAPAGLRARLEDCHIMSRPSELIRRREPGEARSQDYHFLRRAGSFQPDLTGNAINGSGKSPRREESLSYKPSTIH